ncbi:MAG: hypothetical protein WCZ90_03445 [Melioribacteraceae bacterium]
MKIKILTYCLGLLLVGFALANPVTVLSKDRSSSQKLVKDLLSEKNFLIFDQTNTNSRYTKNHTPVTAFYSSLLTNSISRDFQVEHRIALYENKFRTDKWFTTYLKI